jgi:hypothetical protein
MVEKKKAVVEKKDKNAKKTKESEGCSDQCWCCGGHDDFDEED